MAPKLIKKKTVKKVKLPTVVETKKVNADIILSKEPTKQNETIEELKPLRTFSKGSSKKPAKDPEAMSEVVKISRLPYGFFEKELLEFFRQFGKVKRVRVPRSAKTTNFRGYAYVEFDIPEVAEIVAETMDNHMMFDGLIKAQQLKYKELPNKFYYSRRVTIPFSIKKTTVAKDIAKRIAPIEEGKWEQIQERIKSKYEKKQEKLKKMGINFKLPEVMA